MIGAIPAVVLLICGATLLYMAAPNQSLTRSKVSRPIAFIGAIALVAALVLLFTIMGSAAAIFTWVTALMLLWTVPPIVIGWLRWRGHRGLQ